MKTLSCSLLFATMMAASLHAGRSDPVLTEGMKSGDMAGYLRKLTVWLNAKVPANPAHLTEKRVEGLFEDRIFASTLAQRQLISKFGPANLTAFMGEGEQNERFLVWLLGHTEALERFLEGATPIGRAQREADNWTIGVPALQIWSRIFHADSDSRDGLYLRLAMATGLNPPGTGNQGAGQARTPETPLARYRYYKAAHQNGELFPSFDNLSVWEYRQIVSSNASNADLAWGREAINTWRPDLRVNELVVNSTSEVWRRNSPIPFEDTFKNVLAGGGKCGPRSSWSIFICQAFGLPAVGVRQPGHVCATYKSAHPRVQPQPGNVWKVVYGRGWHVSRTCGVSGEEFMEEMALRGNKGKFFRTERHRWLAAALGSGDRPAAIMKLGEKNPTGAEARGGNIPEKPVIVSRAEDPMEDKPGVIHLEAENYVKATGIAVHDCFTGGKQIYNAKYAEGWGSSPRIEYKVEVSTAGTYQFILHAAVANVDQSVSVAVDGGAPLPLPIPNTRGLWKNTPPLELVLRKGLHPLVITRPPAQRGLAVRYLELKKKAQK